MWLKTHLKYKPQRGEKMRKSQILALILTLIFSATFALPLVSAHDPPRDVPTVSYVTVINPIIGVGQPETVFFWSNAVPPTAVGAYGDRWTWTLEITKPDGSVQTLGPWTSDPIGSGYTSYTPDQLGVYTVVAKMADHKITGLPVPPGGYLYGSEATINDTYLGSTSNPVTFTAQEEQIEPWPETPLPEEYWTRPIYAANRDWWQLAGNWLAGAGQQNGPTSNFGWGTGPENGHIMWSTPMWAGGIMDARFGDIGYQTSHYEGLDFLPPIILNGKIYYNVRSLPREGWRVLDLYTGEELWFHNTTGPVTGVSASSSGSIPGESLAFGQILDVENPNQHGGFPYLWSTNHPTEPNTWMMFDAETGNYICSIGNVSAPRGSLNVYGKDGSILYYNVEGSGANKRLTCWNTSRAIWWKPSWSSNEYWMWRPGLNMTYDGNNGFSLNVSIPDLPGNVLAVQEDEILIGGTAGKNNGTYIEEGTLWALSLEAGNEGELLWEYDYVPPERLAPDQIADTPASRNQMYGPFVDIEDGVFHFVDGASVRRYGYSLETGEQLWAGEPEPGMNFLGRSTNVYQGKLLSGGYAGVLTAYNIKTGDIEWTFTAAQEGFESPYGNFPIVITCIADGKIYLVSGEHSATQPLWRGSYLRCIDAETGNELWKLLFWGGAQVAGPEVGGRSVSIADGYLVGLNFYDNQIYCIGKGSSETTVTVQSDVVSWGDSILLTGTVMDIAPGTKQIEQDKRFPNGVAAVADEYQKDWMEYVYMQQQCPSYVEGVKVKLETLDPNNNFYEIGTATSDASGFYSLDWEPPVPGKYTIYATFEGSKSYYRSYSETAFLVTEELLSTSQQMEPEITNSELIGATETPLFSTEVAILIAAVVIMVVGIVGYWILRRRQ
jgi:hypothetical protein